MREQWTPPSTKIPFVFILCALFSFTLPKIFILCVLFSFTLLEIFNPTLWYHEEKYYFMLSWIIIYQGKYIYIYIYIYTHILPTTYLMRVWHPINPQKSRDNLINYMKIRKALELGNYFILPKSLQLHIDLCKLKNRIDSLTFLKS